MSLKSYRQDEEEILTNIQTAVDTAMEHHIERLASIGAKASIASATNLLLTNFLLHRITNKDDVQKLDVFLKQIYLAGINFVKAGKGTLLDFLEQTNQAIEEKWKE